MKVQVSITTNKAGSELDEAFTTIYSMKNFRYQVWNNFVINYDGGTVDVFVNNILMASKGGIATPLDGGNIICGQNKGVLGGIKNTFLFDKVLSRSEVSTLYRLRYIS